MAQQGCSELYWGDLISSVNRIIAIQFNAFETLCEPGCRRIEWGLIRWMRHPDRSQDSESLTMATTIEAGAESPGVQTSTLLRNGDRMTRTEFLRRYHAIPHLSHAELVEGRVYMPSPVSADRHGEPHSDLITWLGTYRAMTPGVICGDNSTLQLDFDNAPQPDGYLRLTEQAGGQSRLVNGYIDGAPELIVEIAASSVSYDLHDKLHAYRRNGVKEYVVWRTEDAAIDWFILVEGRFDPHPASDDGIYRSIVFPGLWLDPTALLQGNMAQVLLVLQEGLATPSHQEFVAAIAQTNAAGRDTSHRG